MAKKRTVWVCRECGGSQAKWGGRCPDCGESNTLTEMVVEGRATASGAGAGAGRPSVAGRSTPQRLSEVSTAEVERQSLPLGEWDRVLGGGVVPGSVVLIGGEPGGYRKLNRQRRCAEMVPQVGERAKGVLVSTGGNWWHVDGR